MNKASVSYVADYQIHIEEALTLRPANRKEKPDFMNNHMSHTHVFIRFSHREIV
jgi:hypothetical protein